jgi:hypothetical protein
MYKAEVVDNKQRLASATAAAAAARGEEESRDASSPVCHATTAWLNGGEEPWEVKNAVCLATPWTALIPFLTLVQKSLIRESENMVRDTATRLERATGELGDLVVR